MNLRHNLPRLRRRLTCPALIAGIGIALSLAGAATAQIVTPQPELIQPAPGEPRTLDELIIDLSAPEFEKRDRASLRLTTDAAITFAELEAALTTRQLPLEAHSRLMNAARERFRYSPRGAMGVGFDLRSLRYRIVIARTYAPFPCHSILEPGDIIIEADGIRLHGPTAQPTIQGLIVARDPGSVMKLVVRRGAEKLELDVPLGRFADLENSNLDEIRLARAWKTRSRQYLAPGDEPIVTPIHSAAWPVNNQALQQRQAEQIKLRSQTSSPITMVSSGGEASMSRMGGEYALYNQQIRMMNGQRLNPFIQNAQAAQLLLDFDEFNPGPVPSTADELRIIEQEMTIITGNLDRAKLDVSRARPGTPEARNAADRLEGFEAQQKVLVRLREAITAEQAENDADARREGSSAASVPGQD